MEQNYLSPKEILKLKKNLMPKKNATKNQQHSASSLSSQFYKMYNKEIGIDFEHNIKQILEIYYDWKKIPLKRKVFYRKITYNKKIELVTNNKEENIVIKGKQVNFRLNENKSLDVFVEDVKKDTINDVTPHNLDLFGETILVDKPMEFELDGIYENFTMEKFNNQEYATCIALCVNGRREYADLPVADNFLYLKAKCEGRLHNTEAMKTDLQTIVDKNPNSQLAKAAQAKIDAINTGNFNYAKFLDSDNENHYVVILQDKLVVDNAPKININFIAINFCAENGYSNADVQDQTIASKKIVKISTFANKMAADEFCRNFYSANYNAMPENEFRLFSISKTNFSRIESSEDIDAYYNYYLSKFFLDVLF